MMIASAGSTQNKVIDDYPTAIENVDEMLVIDEEVPEEEISDALEWDLEKYSNANGNSLKETGTYVFDPTAIPLAYLNANEKYPEKIAFIRLALQSIYEGRKELIIPDELHLGKLEVDLFLQQIQDCNPLSQSIGFSKIEDNRYEIVYFPDSTLDPSQSVDIDYVREQNKMFINYVEETINSTVSKDDSDAEIAEKIYVKLIKDFSVLSVDETNSAFFGFIDFEGAGYENNSGVENHFPCVVEQYNQKYVIEFEFPSLYMFFMDQLHIDCYVAGSRGSYVEQDTPHPTLDEHMTDFNMCPWNIIYVDEKPYNCIIIFDYFDYQDIKADYPDSEPELEFFGISDEKRKAIWDSNGMVYISSTTESKDAPKCEEDLKKNEE